jgi:hypothetical protein
MMEETMSVSRDLSIEPMTINHCRKLKKSVISSVLAQMLYASFDIKN